MPEKFQLDPDLSPIVPIADLSPNPTHPDLSLIVACPCLSQLSSWTWPQFLLNVFGRLYVFIPTRDERTQPGFQRWPEIALTSESGPC